jgi:ATP-dependent Lon protease
MVYQYCYKTIRNENKLINIQKQHLINMMNNLLHMNSMNLYQDNEAMFSIILNELKTIKNELDKYPTIVYKINNKSNFTDIYNSVQNKIIKYSNHISSSNIVDIFNLLDYKYDNSSMMQFIIKHFKPINVWSYEHHKSVPYDINPNKIIKKNKNILPSILDSLLSKNEINIKTIISDSSKTCDNIIVKSVNELANENNNMEHGNVYNYNDCLNILGNNTIQFTKNNNSISLLEETNGLILYIKYNKYNIIAIQCIVLDDILRLLSATPFIQQKIKNIKSILSYDAFVIPKHFKDNYIKTQSLRDIIVVNKIELVEDIKKKFNDFKLLQLKPLIDLINEFLLSSKYRKIDILTLLLMSNIDDQKVAYILFDIFKMKDKKNIAIQIYNSLHYSIRELLDITKNTIDKDDYQMTKILDSDISYERRISLMKVSDDIKAKAYEKLKMTKSNAQNDGKAAAWLDGLLKIPFGIYNDNHIISFKKKFINKLGVNTIFSDNDINIYLENNLQNKTDNDEWAQYKIQKTEYLHEIRKNLDNAVYGHKDAKLQLERLFAQWINGESKGAVIGLMGPPGTGKTSLAKHGLSKCLKDVNGNARPFAFLPIGGSVNSSTLVGHNFTYVGSTWGRIVDILITTQCMNPIIFIDEIDKVSQTEYGREIISVLTHLTDPTQNNEFEDKYFAGIPLDLSKALIVFSFNDASLLDPILRDRITIIDTHPLKLHDKLTIINDYMLPEICRDVGFNKNEIIINNDIIKHIIETYTMEAGVRKIKEKITEIIRDINLNRFHNNNFMLPYTVTFDYVNKLFENKPKIRVKKINNKPMVGLVNGLYATASGVGGLTIIQLSRFPSEKMLDIQLTGKPGDMMKESVQYALKVAWSLLNKKEQDKFIKDSHNKKSFGIHIHCPDAATPKDGPSAGVAFTLAIYSLLTNKKIDNKICMTGEIDLLGNVLPIGGVESKLFGGKNSGCNIALIPQENWEDYEILKRELNIPLDFEVKPISHIKEVLKMALVNI